MNTKTLGALPNYLHERNIGEIKARCVALFVEVALERDRARRLELMMQRDLLHLEIFRLESNRVAVRGKRNVPAKTPTNDRKTAKRTVKHRVVKRTENPIRWYSRELLLDRDYGSPIDINEMAKACQFSAKKHKLMASDVLSAACEAWMTGEGYSRLNAKTRINRAVSKAIYEIYRENYAVHNYREQAKLKPGQSFRKWTPLVDDALIELVFGK
jgi:hypothetical protein